MFLKTKMYVLNICQSWFKEIKCYIVNYTTVLLVSENVKVFIVQNCIYVIIVLYKNL